MLSNLWRCAVRRSIPLFFTLMFLVGTDTFLVSPLLPTLSALYRIQTAQSGWITSAYAIGYFALALIAGPLSDHGDKKRVLVLGFLGFAVSTSLCALAVTFPLMLLFRFLAGACAAVACPQIWASIPLLVDRQHLIRAMGYVSAALSVSQLAGVPVGSFLAAASWRLPFTVIGGAALVMCLVAWRLLPPLVAPEAAHPTPTQRPGILATYRAVLANRTSVTVLLGYFLFQAGNFAVLNFIGTWMHRDFALPLTGIGTAMIFIGVGNLIGTVFGSRLSERIGLRRSLVLGFAALFLLYLLLPFAPGAPLATVGLTLVMLVNGFIFPLFMTLLQSTSTGARSTMSSLGNAAMYAGSSVAGVVGGGLIAVFPGFFGIAGFTIVAYALSLATYAIGGSLRRDRCAEASRGT